jgi:hypothetical protein
MKYALPKWLMLACYAWILCILGLCIAVSLEISAWRRLGRRLDIEPTHAGLDAYLHATIKHGMSSEQVHRELDFVAPTVVRPLATGRPETCEEVFFKIGPLPFLEPGYDICYNRDGELIRFTTVY